MIVSYRDKRTREFATGKRIKAFSGIETITRGNSYAGNSIHPGEHLAEELEILNMSAAELARELKVPTNRITGILNGHRAITGDTALRFGHFFGTSAEFWLNLQSLYELRLAEKKAWKSIKVLPTLKERAQTHR